MHATEKPWQSLRQGDTVDIIAPGARCHESVLDKVKILLESWGLQSHIPQDIFGDDLLCANTDAKRSEQLQQALLNKKSKAIWCLLGGYGSARLLPALEKITPPEHNKIFIGFSDITALHIFLQEKWGWPTIHGPSARMSALDKNSKESIAILKNILFKETNNVTYNKLLPLNKLAEEDKEIVAPIVGGNLCLTQTSLGTFWQINATEKILLIEERNERGYRIDRMLEQLNQAGIIDQAKAILIGDFSGGEEPDGTSFVAATIKRFVNACKIPVIQIRGVGHEFVNLPVILGQPAQLKTGNNAALVFPL